MRTVDGKINKKNKKSKQVFIRIFHVIVTI